MLKPHTVVIGILAVILTPFLMALSLALLSKYNLWSPKIISSGHIYSPAIPFDPIRHNNPSDFWTVLVIEPPHQTLDFEKWRVLPEFFPKNPLSIQSLDPQSIPSAIYAQLQNPLDFDLASPGVLLIEDSRGFIAMSFSSDIVVQDVLKDLKKILPKTPVRRTS